MKSPSCKFSTMRKVIFNKPCLSSVLLGYHFNSYLKILLTVDFDSSSPFFWLENLDSDRLHSEHLRYSLLFLIFAYNGNDPYLNLSIFPLVCNFEDFQIAVMRGWPRPIMKILFK